MRIIFTDDEVKDLERKVKEGCIDRYFDLEKGKEYDKLDCDSCLIPFLMGGDSFNCQEFQKNLLEKIKDNVLEM